jgi:hypothetical protein
MIAMLFRKTIYQYVAAENVRAMQQSVTSNLQSNAA